MDSAAKEGNQTKNKTSKQKEKLLFKGNLTFKLKNLPKKILK
jgi:hypothetical protein